MAKTKVVHRHTFENETQSSLNPKETLKCGTVIEFKYDSKKKDDQKGGWHSDPKPRVIVIYDDKKSGYLCGINVNYLPWTYYTRLINIINEKDYGENGKAFYKMLEKRAPWATRKAYRMYMRNVLMKRAKIIKQIILE